MPLPHQVDVEPTGMDENPPTPPSPRNELELITEEELSQLLKVTKRHLYNWRIRGVIPYFKLGRVVRYRIGDVLAALEARRLG